MTDLPPPVLPPRPSSRTPAVLAWLIIVLLVSFIVYRNSQTGTSDGDATSKVAKNDVDILKIQAKAAIGIKSFAAQSSKGMSIMMGDTKSGPMIDGMEEYAVTSEDELHVAIVTGEIEGGDQALEKLDAIAKCETNPGIIADITALRTIYTTGVATLDDASQHRLILRHDFFAQVALAYGAPADSEPRKSIESSSSQMVIILGVVGLAAMALALISFCLFITALVLLFMGKLHRAYAPDPVANTAFLEGFALYLLLFVSYGFVVRALGGQTLSWEWPCLLLIPAVMYWAAQRGATAEQRRRGFGWYRGRGWYIEIPLGIVGYLACAPVMMIGFLTTYFLIKHPYIFSGTGHPIGLPGGSPGGPPLRPDHPLLHMLHGDGWHMLTLYCLACGLAPVLEETMFRGALFHHLRRRWSWWISAPIVAFIFAVIHPQGWMMVPALGSFALVVAALREWRGSILAPMAAHAFNNFMVLSLAFMIAR